VIHGNRGLEQIVLRGVRIRTSRDQEQRYDVVSWGQLRRLEHREEAQKFYRDLAAQGMKVRLGMEASGHARWFERLLAELQINSNSFLESEMAASTGGSWRSTWSPRLS
jgi:hypothetical protein